MSRAATATVIILLLASLAANGILYTSFQGLAGDQGRVLSDIAQLRDQLRELAARPPPSRQGGPAQPPTVQSLTDLYRRVAASVVALQVFTRAGTAAGSGWVYDAAGHVVTNAHVVDGAREIRVHFATGGEVRADLVGADVYSDLAVVRLRSRGDLLANAPPLPLGDSSALQIGDAVLAVGNPFNLAGSLTTGVVSQRNRLLPAARGFSIANLLQIDVAINPGNSGGPVLNLAGEVVGVTTAIASTTGTFSGVGFAVPSATIRQVVPALIREGRYEHAFLGISGSDLSLAVAEAMRVNTTRGVLVVEVVANGPAARAGLRGSDRTAVIDGARTPVGGDIIVTADGRTVIGLEDLLGYIDGEKRPGDTVRFTILRGNQILTIDVVLGPRPPP